MPKNTFNDSKWFLWIEAARNCFLAYLNIKSPYINRRLYCFIENKHTWYRETHGLPRDRGIFRDPYHLTCRVLNFWLPSVGCWKIEEFVCFTLKFACFSSKQTDFVSIQDELAQNLKFLIDNRHVSRIRRVLICNINTPLHAGGLQIHQRIQIPRWEKVHKFFYKLIMLQ